MYCKHCGKEIDNDSKFCKECGKPLDIITNSTNIHTSFFQKNLILISLIVIWYIIGYIYSSAYYGRHSGIIFGMYFVTPMIMGVLYWIYKQNCKYQIQLFDKADSLKIKLLKYAYLAYTYFIPFSCSDGLGDDYFVFFVILGLVWLVPTFIICAIYYFIQYRKAVK